MKNLKESYILIQTALNEIKPKRGLFFLFTIFIISVSYVTKPFNLPYYIGYFVSALLGLYLNISCFYISKVWYQNSSFQFAKSLKITRYKDRWLALIPYLIFKLVVSVVIGYGTVILMRYILKEKYHPFFNSFVIVIFESLFLFFNEFTLPLIIDQNFTFFQAVKESWKMTMKNFILIVVVSNFITVGSLLLAIIGLSLIFVSEKILHSSYTLHVCIFNFIVTSIWIGYFLGLGSYLQFFLYKTFYPRQKGA